MFGLQCRLLKSASRSQTLRAAQAMHVIPGQARPEKHINDKVVSQKERQSKPRSQIKGVEVLRNPSYFKVSFLFCLISRIPCFLIEKTIIFQGMAFSIEERQVLGIHGLLPPAVLDQDVQVLRVMTNFHRETDDLDRYTDLMNLQDRNEKLFYRILKEYLEVMMPVVYTPTVGLACQKYGIAFRRARFVHDFLKTVLKILLKGGLPNSARITFVYYLVEEKFSCLLMWLRNFTIL